MQCFQHRFSYKYIDVTAETTGSQSITPNCPFCRQNRPNINSCRTLPLSAIRNPNFDANIVQESRALKGSKPHPTLPVGGGLWRMRLSGVVVGRCRSFPLAVVRVLLSGGDARPPTLQPLFHKLITPPMVVFETFRFNTVNGRQTPTPSKGVTLWSNPANPAKFNSKVA